MVLRGWEEEEEEQSLSKHEDSHGYEVLATSFFLASTYKDRWPVFSLTDSSSHWQCTVNVLIVIAELARVQMEQKSQTKFLPWSGFEPRTSQLAVQCTNL